MKIIECVPNISEGKDINKINEIAAEVKKANCQLLHVDPGPQVNRSVITFLGDQPAIEDAAFRFIAKTSELIDMRSHKGAHPRMGAVDVFPLIPISCSMEDCIDSSKRIAERVFKELDIPVFLYNESAIYSYRKSLANVRKGEYEGLSLRQDIPDYWNGSYHPTAGVAVIGARKILIAYNITLQEGTSIDTAKKIAQHLREKTSKDANGNIVGGFAPYCRAIGWQLDSTNTVQLSFNLTDYTVTGLYRIFKKSVELAGIFGSSVSSSEVIGMIPQKALYRVAYDLDKKNQQIDNEDQLINIAVEFLQLKNFNPREKILYLP